MVTKDEKGQKGGQEKQNKEGERNYKNIEESVNNPSYFSDDEEVKREDEISEDDMRSEPSDRPAKR